MTREKAETIMAEYLSRKDIPKDIKDMHAMVEIEDIVRLRK